MMTITANRQQQLNRLSQLAKLSRKRYLEEGGDSRLSVGSLNHNDCLTDEEQQEFTYLLSQLISEQDIVNYQQQYGTWKDKLAKLNESQK